MQASPRWGEVRCLGWENLERNFDDLSHAVAHTITVLDAPAEIIAQMAQLPSGWVVHPHQPPDSVSLRPVVETGSADVDMTPASSSEEDLAPGKMPPLILPPSPDLRVAIQIFAAEAENVGKFHVRLRRTQGSHWRFQAFYAEFRKAFSENLGLSDERQLSFYSPMQTKRTLEQANAAAPGWGRAGCASRDMGCASLGGALAMPSRAPEPSGRIGLPPSLQRPSIAGASAGGAGGAYPSIESLGMRRSGKAPRSMLAQAPTGARPQPPPEPPPV